MEKKLKRKKLFGLIVISILLFMFGFINTPAQGFKSFTSLAPITAAAGTGEKPQSKVWFYDDHWFAVIPVSGGTYLYRLDGITWTQLIQISSQTLVKADVKVSGATTYILLKNSYTDNGIPQNQTAYLMSVNYSGAGTYTLVFTTSIPLDTYCETATIDIDSGGRIWLASDGGGISNSFGNKNIFVRYSDSPYSSFSSPIIIATGVNFDDICDVTSFGGNKIGILWSDQENKKFSFAYHIDDDAVTTWQLETAASGASSGGIADDHINLAVASDGTIYAAVKTSYTDPTLPTIGLLVRRPGGTWDPIYPVTKFSDGSSSGTRPIVLLNEIENIISVAYTERDGYRHIIYKESPTNPINFPATRFQYLRNSRTYDNNVSSTKQNYSDSVVFLFSTSSNVWDGVIANRNGQSTINGAGYSLGFNGIGNQLEVENSSSINLTGALTIEAWINPNSNKSQSILNKATSSNGYELALTSAGKIRFVINGTTELISSSYCELSTWTHIAATYNTSGDMKIYINGVLDSQNSVIESLLQNNETLYIGSLDTYGFFDGSLDEIRLWDKEKTIDEIRTDMCKKLTGSESNLVGYWNFDTEEGLNIPDKSPYNNYATMYDMNDYLYSWSGADIGDASVYDYTGSNPGDFIASLGIGTETFTASGAGGAITGIQVYRVDDNSLRTGSTVPSGWTIDPLRYWGVNVIGTSASYDVIYDYTGHPGIGDETGLNLLYRDNISDNSWEDLFAILNTSANTLTKTGLTGNEIALASINDPLPVELSLFNAVKLKSGILLTWRTETEVSNYGFNVERRDFLKTPGGGKYGNWKSLGFVEGNGNANSPNNYSFVDNNLTGEKHNYRLKQIDTDGKFAYSEIIEINLDSPDELKLVQNYPNPFNPSTTISFSIPEAGQVKLTVFNILGEEVTTLINGFKEAGVYSINFDATGLNSGIYLYRIIVDTPDIAGKYVKSKKMMLIK